MKAARDHPRLAVRWKSGGVPVTGGLFVGGQHGERCLWCVVQVGKLSFIEGIGSGPGCGNAVRIHGRGSIDDEKRDVERALKVALFINGVDGLGI